MTEYTPSVVFPCLHCGASLGIDEIVITVVRSDTDANGEPQVPFGYGHPDCEAGVVLQGYRIVGRGKIRELEAKRRAPFV